MSTEIGRVEGRIEDDRDPKVYHSTYLKLTEFWGGEEKGIMLQLTVACREGYIQLSDTQVKNLIEILQEWKKLPEIT